MKKKTIGIIANILQSGMDMLRDDVKSNNMIKVEQTKYRLETERQKTEFVYAAGKTATDVISDVIGKTVEHIVDNQAKKTDAVVDKIHSEIEINKAESDEDLIEKRIRFDQEMEELKKDQDLQRRKDVLQAIQEYQIEVTRVVNESMCILAGMPLELQQKAENLLSEEQQKFQKLKENWESDAIEKIEQIEKSFANNEKMKDRMQKIILDDMEDMIQLSKDTLRRMGKDIEKINENARNFSVEGQKMVTESYKSMQLGGKSQYLLEEDNKY